MKRRGLEAIQDDLTAYFQNGGLVRDDEYMKKRLTVKRLRQLCHQHIDDKTLRRHRRKNALKAAHEIIEETMSEDQR